MKPAFWLLACIALAAVPGLAGEASPPPDVARKVSSSFAGSLLVTADADWRRKWDAATDVKPQLPAIDTIRRGNKLWVLVFFSNPKLDAGGVAHVACDLTFIKPDGTTAVDRKGIACFTGRLLPAPGMVYLANQTIEFVGEPADPTGTWKVAVKLRDMTRGAEVSLFTAFTLRD